MGTHRRAISIESNPDTWVVCLGRMRTPEGGLIHCPADGSAVSIAQCLVCHHLETLGAERDAGSECATPEHLRLLAPRPR